MSALNLGFLNANVREWQKVFFMGHKKPSGQQQFAMSWASVQRTVTGWWKIQSNQLICAVRQV